MAPSSQNKRRLLFSLETILGIDLEIFTRRGKLEDLDEFIIIQNPVTLSCAPARGNVLNAFGDEIELRFLMSPMMSLNTYGHLDGGHKLLISLMRPARLERATFWFVAKRSIQLSYGRF
jgi:hypothetical protein